MAVATLAAFTGAFPSALPPVFTITAAPAGGWLNAAHREGTTFIVYPVESTGNIEVVAVDEATQQVTGPVVIAAAFHNDAHSSPFIHVRSSDQRLMVWYSEHNGSTIFQRVSTNPLDISSWGSATSLDAALGGNLYTYVSAFEHGDLWLFYRDATQAGVEGTVAYSTSSDGGATWAAQTRLLVNSGELVYHAVTLSDRLDILASNGHPAQTTATVHHLYHDGTWRRSDGTALTGSPPFGIEDLTEVYDGSDGTASLWDIARVSGSLRIAYSVNVSGSVWDYRVATWDGSWSSEVVGEPGSALSGSPNPPGVRLSRHVAGDTYLVLPVSGVHQLHRLRGGTLLQLTYGSTNHLLPHWVNGGGTTRMLVLKGTYTDSDDYSVGIVGSRL